MRYGHFDDANKEYVIDRVDLPTSWTNYLGVEDMAAVVNHTAGGYAFYKSPEYHRISRFHANSVPMDRPGFYVYLRDSESGDYWSTSWQPVGKPLDQAKYTTRHGLSYTVYECDYNGISSSEKLCIPRGENVLLWDVRVKNTDSKKRKIKLFSYLEFSFHHVMIDNINFQMSLYCAGGSYKDGIIEEDLYYEEDGYQYFTSSFEPDGFDCVRDKFIGTYNTETNPQAVIDGVCSGSEEKGMNHCGTLMKEIELAPGEEQRFVFILGEGRREEGFRTREKYCGIIAGSDKKTVVGNDTACNTFADNAPDSPRFAAVDAAYEDLAAYWKDKCDRMVINTPNAGMNSLINAWTLYQSEINVMFSRFASFIEVGGRVGLGYRDTAQDSMTIPHSNPDKCRERIEQLLKGLTTTGYGLHLFQPEWFEADEKEQSFDSPTVVPKADKSVIHGLSDACSDDCLWLIPSIVNYVKETGDFDFIDKKLTYADTWVAGDTFAESVYDHMKRILDFSAEQVGENGICKGLRADWNDCLNLGGGESAMVSCLHYWALESFIELAEFMDANAAAGCCGEVAGSETADCCGEAAGSETADCCSEAAGSETANCCGEKASAESQYRKDINRYREIADKVQHAVNTILWDGEWFLRGFTKSGRKIGCQEDEEGKVHLESNSWAILSGAADREKSEKALDAIDKYLYTQYGLLLNQPAYTKPDSEIGFVTRVYPGLKENAAVFSHPNPWAQAAACKLGRGDIAMKFYDALCPYNQNDIIEIRESEPYSYCQFIAGRDHSAFGRARHPFMTGSGGWSYFAATQYILGIRPEFDSLTVDPCVPADWKEFEVSRIFRGATYNIKVNNASGSMKGVKSIKADGQIVEKLPVFEAGSVHEVVIEM